MPASVSPIPLSTAIVDPKQGSINIFFRLLWEQIRTVVQYVSTIGSGVTLSAQTAALVGTLLHTTTTSGLYRVTYYARKTVADGVSSSLTFRWHWTENGVPLSKTGTALTTDTTGAVISETFTFFADANVNLTIDVDYASNTPNKMAYALWVRAEYLN